MQFYINLNSRNNFVRFAKEKHPVDLERLAGNSPASCSMSLGTDKSSISPIEKTGQSDRSATQSATSFGPPNRSTSKMAAGGAPIQTNNHPKHHGNSKHSSDPVGQGIEARDGEQLDSRPFDVIIFAASGSVGRFLVEEMALVVNKLLSSQSVSPLALPPGQSMAANGSKNELVQPQQQQHDRRRSVPSSIPAGDVKWAIAGRSAVKLSETLNRAELSTGIADLSASIPVILADLNHQRSLLDMCRKTSIVINCAGPYSDLGTESLIEACIECSTNYIDLAQETTFVERVNRNYSEAARQKGVFVLNGCGFQSMSAEIGLNFTKQVADGRIEQVKVILSLSDTKSIRRPAQRARGLVSEGMWNSLLSEKGQEISVEERLKSRAQIPNRIRSPTEYKSQDQHRFDEETGKLMRLTLERPDGADRHVADDSIVETPAEMLHRRKDTRSLVQDMMQFRNRNVSAFSWPLRFIQDLQNQRGRGYCWPIDNIVSDESQLIRGEMNNYELRQPDSDGWRPIRCTTFVSVKHFTHLCLLSLWLFVFQLLVKFSLARYAMRKIPGLVSLGHVSTRGGASSGWLSSGFPSTTNQQQQYLDRDALSHIKYCQTFIAYGTPGDDSGDPLEDRRQDRNHSNIQLLVARVVGPEPNHIATATFCIQAALTTLMERDHLPGHGGVLTPGAAFFETNIIYQLRKRNIKFEVLKKA